MIRSAARGLSGTVAVAVARVTPATRPFRPGAAPNSSARSGTLSSVAVHDAVLFIRSASRLHRSVSSALHAPCDDLVVRRRRDARTPAPGAIDPL
jgi:hypothetical protein